MKQVLIALSFVPLFSLKGIAQHFDKEKLDSLYHELELNKKAMGSIALAKNGELVYNRAIGFRVYTNQNKIPADCQTKYRIGSISKIFTAVIIFQLIEEGRLSLSTTLDIYFPNFPKAGKINIGHLLAHRSPIRNITSIESKELPRSEEQMLELVADRMHNFESGAKSSYSNANYLLLGYIIEKICRKPFGEVLHERIASRLNLVNTYYGYTPGQANESVPYQLNQDWEQQPVTDCSIPGASGGIVSTPADLIVFISALFQDRLLRHESLDRMATVRDGYGMGFLEFKFNKKKAFGYTGGIDGFESVLAYFPDDSLAVAYCSNANIYSVRNIVYGSLHIYFNDTYKIPDFKHVSVLDAKLYQYTGVYASAEIPLRITIKRYKKTLVAQAVGQDPYPLEALAANKFRCEEAAVTMEFMPVERKMRLRRDGRSYILKKED